MPQQKAATRNNRRQRGGQWEEEMDWLGGGFVIAPWHSPVRQTLVSYLILTLTFVFQFQKASTAVRNSYKELRTLSEDFFLSKDGFGTIVYTFICIRRV